MIGWFHLAASHRLSKSQSLKFFYLRQVVVSAKVRSSYCSFGEMSLGKVSFGKMSVHQPPLLITLCSLITMKYRLHIRKKPWPAVENLAINTTACIKTLINSNCKILYCNNSMNNNQLLLLEALYVKFLKPELNCRLKASKYLTLFCWFRSWHKHSCRV